MPNGKDKVKSRVVVALAVAAFAAFFSPAAWAESAGCKDWATRWAHISAFEKFFVVEGEHRENLVGNFNLAPPRTELAPDLVGYSWGGGYVRLFMVGSGCILAERLYPLKLVWAMMGSYPLVPVAFDKSGERYLREMDEQQALRQRLQEQAREAERLRLEDEESEASDNGPMEDLD